MQFRAQRETAKLTRRVSRPAGGFLGAALGGGVGQIVSNIMTGRPWDEGLLYSVATTAAFEGISTAAGAMVGGQSRARPGPDMDVDVHRPRGVGDEDGMLYRPRSVEGERGHLRLGSQDVGGSGSQGIPTVMASAQNEVELKAYAARSLGVRPSEVSLDLISGQKGRGVSGDPVYLVVGKDGTLAGVVKVFTDETRFSHELSALSRLKQGGMAKMGSVEALGVGKAESGEGILVMSAAPGKALRDYMDDVETAPSPVARAEAMERLNTAVSETAIAMAELHTRPKGSGGSVALEYVDYYVGQMNDITRQIVQRPDILSGADITPEEFNVRVGDVVRGFEQNPGTGSWVHGDAHPGNFFFDVEAGVTAIDTPTLLRSMDAEGNPVGSAARDVANFDQKLVFYGRARGFSNPEIAVLRETFMRSLSWPNNTSVLFQGEQRIRFVTSETIASSKAMNELN